MNKKKNRLKRAKKTRYKIKNMYKLVIYRSNKHIYAQIIIPGGSKTLISASTLEKKIKKKINYTGNKKSAFYIGKIIAKRSLKKNIKNVAFDRSGYKYHGRIRELANSARKYGLNF